MQPINRAYLGKVIVNIQQNKSKNIHIVFTNELDADRLKFRLIAAGVIDSALAEKINYQDSRYPNQFLVELSEEQYKNNVLRFKDDMPPHDIFNTLDEVSTVKIDSFPTVATFANLGYDEKKKKGVGVDDTGLKTPLNPHYIDEKQYTSAYKTQRRIAKAKLSSTDYEEYKLQAKERSLPPYISRKEQAARELTLGYGGMFLERRVNYNPEQMTTEDIAFVANNNPVIRRATAQEDKKRDNILVLHQHSILG